MKKNICYTAFALVLCFAATAQEFRFRQGGNAPKFIRPVLNDTLLNPFAGGLNTPQLSNIDWNGDGKQDLFIFDKEASKVSCYVYENGRFRHEPQYESAFPNYLTGWALLKDHNFDNRPDLFTAGFTHTVITAEPRLLSNTTQLFVNKPRKGKPHFEQFSNCMFDTGFSIPTWTFPPNPINNVSGALPAIDDMDGDGDIDFLTSRNENPTIMYYDNLKKNKWNVPFHNDSVAYIIRDQCWGFIYYNYKHYYSLHVSRKTNNECEFNTWGKQSRKDGDQSMLLLDLNGDGIKDYIMGDVLYKSFIALLNGKLQNSLQADSIVSQDTLFLSTNNSRKEFMEYPAAYYVDLNGDNKNELVISTNKLKASKNVNNFWLYDVARVGSNLQFTPQNGSDLLYRDMIDLGFRTAPAFTDVDRDGDQDLVVATSGNYESTYHNNDRLYLYKNITDSVNPVFQLTDSNFARLSDVPGPGFFFAHPTFGDLNGDGKQDLLIGDGNGYISWFKNTSAGGTYSYELVSKNAFGIQGYAYATPQLVDLDKDGLPDLVAGNVKGTINFYKNRGTATAPDFADTPTISGLGGIDSREVFYALGRDPKTEEFGYSAPHVIDLDNDGDYEMVVGSATGRVYVYDGIYPHKDSLARAANNCFIDDQDAYNKRFGNRSTVTSAYLDGDNKPDLILGNISGGLVFLSNAFNTSPSGLNDHMENDQHALTVFPNPATATVNIRLNRASAAPLRYAFYDLTGREVLSGSLESTRGDAQIAVSGLRNGLYFIRFESTGWYSTQKLMIGN